MVLALAGVFHGFHFYLDDITRGHDGHFVRRMLEEISGSVSVGLLLPFVVTLARRTRVRGRILAALGIHVCALLAFSFAHTSLIWASRLLLAPLLGLGDYDYGQMPWRYAMEFGSDVVTYGLIVFLTWLLDQLRAGRARELRAAQLEGALAEARLDALRLQLNPHFLFNALNAVSSVMYENPRVADEMLARIGQLLRVTLRASANEHTLGEELHLLELYLDVQRARFGSQLDARVSAMDDSLLRVRVPFLLLQPLAENAIEHAGGEHRVVHVEVSRQGNELTMHVRDRGAGSGHHQGHGIGLGNVRERLDTLYGARAGVELSSTDEGTHVRVWLPAEVSP